MPRFEFAIEGERHAFAHLLVDRIEQLEPERIAAFQLPLLVQDRVLLILEGIDATDAAEAVQKACKSIMSDIERAFNDLSLSQPATEISLNCELPKLSMKAL